MRADRLLSLMMLLQARGRMTAQQLARELEVSERTIYRDVDALSGAGVPIYAERGPEGGYALLDSYRTDLTGLTEDQVRALFMLTIPAPLADLGVSGELKAAMLKLRAALPPALRTDGERVRQRIHLDSVWWFQGEEPLPYLQTLQDAVWQDRRAYITVRQTYGLPVEIEWLVDPYGLVAKAGIWYLVCAQKGTVRARRVSRLVTARLSDEFSERPAGFDLGVFWEEWCAGFEGGRPHYPVTARISPQLAPHLPRLFGPHMDEALAGAAPPDAAGWITLQLSFETLEAARDRVLGLGGAIEVLAPEPLRRTVLDFAQQTVARYASSPNTASP